MRGVGRPSWRDGKGREVLQKGWEESGVSPGVLGGVGRPSWRDRRVERDERGWESPQEGQEGSEVLSVELGWVEGARRD